MLVDTGRSADNTPHVTHSLITFPVVRGRAHLMQLVHLHHLLLMKRTLILFFLCGLLDQLQLSNNITCTALLLQLYLLHQLLLLFEYLMPLNLNPIEVLELGQA
jgi:hypothetical protein